MSMVLDIFVNWEMIKLTHIWFQPVGKSLCVLSIIECPNYRIHINFVRIRQIILDSEEKCGDVEFKNHIIDKEDRRVCFEPPVGKCGRC